MLQVHLSSFAVCLSSFEAYSVTFQVHLASFEASLAMLKVHRVSFAVCLSSLEACLYQLLQKSLHASDRQPGVSGPGEVEVGEHDKAVVVECCSLRKAIISVVHSSSQCLTASSQNLVKSQCPQRSLVWLVLQFWPEQVRVLEQKIEEKWFQGVENQRVGMVQVEAPPLAWTELHDSGCHLWQTCHALGTV